MSSLLKFMNALLEERIAEIHTCMPCRVLSFNEEKGTADVLPLYMRKYIDTPPQEYTPIMAVPVLRRKYKDDNGVVRLEQVFYEKGDIVVVSFAERALDNVISGKIADPKYSRKHDLKDAIIIGHLR